MFLVLNTGSSTIKFSLLGPGDEAVLTGEVQTNVAPTSIRFARQGVPQPSRAIAWSSHEELLAQLFGWLEREVAREPGRTIEAIGHRVVHGGALFQEPARISDDVLARIDQLSPLAPLHNPAALEEMRAAQRAFPDLPQYAVFDSAFFHSLPESRRLYPVPRSWEREHGVRRYGFHGISHAYSLERSAELLGRSPADLRLVCCHLGAGCSATACAGGKAVATTMGFTPLDGLMMATRPGSLDPGILTYIQPRLGISAAELDHLLNQECGLKAIAGLSDYRQVERAAHDGNREAQLGLEMFADHIRQTIAALAATIGGLDVLVFTAGIGENAAGLREGVAGPLRFLGIEIDAERNRQGTGDRRISLDQARVATLVIQAREDVQIARDVRRQERTRLA